MGRDIYEILIKEYTEKQWGRKCAELPPFIIKRLPVRFTYDNNYFDDTYQGIPIGGYNQLIEELLKGVETISDTDFFRILVNGKIWQPKLYLLGKLMSILIIVLGNSNIVQLGLKQKSMIYKIIKGMQL